MTTVILRPLAAIGLLSSVVVANYAVARYGLVPVGFGLMAPAGVYVVGVAFTLRDLVHEFYGRRGVVFAIVAGAALSYAVAAPRLAIASGVAFLLSELADLAVYEPLRRRRRWLLAVALSNVVGLLVDSAIFLTLAFGSLAFLPGQVVGKGWMTLLAVAILLSIRRRWRLVAA